MLPFAALLHVTTLIASMPQVLGESVTFAKQDESKEIIPDIGSLSL